MRAWSLAWKWAAILVATTWTVSTPAKTRTWAPHTASADSLRSVAPGEAPLYALCGKPDSGLARVASTLVARQLAGDPPMESAALREAMRETGLPYMWPRVWMLAEASDKTDITTRLKEWSGTKRVEGARRCGIARGHDPQKGKVIVAVQVDVLSDLAAIPTQVRRGRWLQLDAQMRVAASNAKVVLLPPRGYPRSVLTSLSPRGRVRSRFAVDQAGRWLVQVVATTKSGPTPVIEAPVFVEVKPRPAEQQTLSAPAARATADQAVLAWLNNARARQALRPLKRDEALDRLAKAHTKQMIRKGQVAHQLGQGDAAQRVQRAGLSFVSIGENVARAATPQRAHLALHGSPAHRATMLMADFERIGLAALRGPAGKLWVTQIFAGAMSRSR